MKPFAISEPHLTLSEVSMREQGQRRLQARKESRRPPLAQPTLTVSACVLLHNISKLPAFPMF